MFERIIAKWIFQHTKTIWRTNKQYGFLPGKSTVDAVIQVIDDWGFAVDRNIKLLAIFFDFAKAFDLVDHEVLLEKLQKLLSNWLTAWIATYLSNRRQRVYFNGSTTTWKDVLAGVIQGSVLGPVLFLLFIFDINDFLPTGVTLFKYADDILAYVTGLPLLCRSLIFYFYLDLNKVK